MSLSRSVFLFLCFPIPIKNPFYIFFFKKKTKNKTGWARFSVISHLYHLNTTRCGKDWQLMAKTLDQNSAYSVVHFIMFISLCLFLFIDSCYYRLFSLVLSTVLRKFMFLGHLVSLFDILGVREKFRIHFCRQLASLDILRHCILTHLIFPGM